MALTAKNMPYKHRFGPFAGQQPIGIGGDKDHRHRERLQHFIDGIEAGTAVGQLNIGQHQAGLVLIDRLDRFGMGASHAGDAVAEALRSHRLGDFFLNEGPAGGQLFAKRLRRDVDGIALPANGRVAAEIEIERNAEAGAARRFGGDPTVAAADAHRLLNDDLPHRAALLDDASVIDRCDEIAR